MSNLKYEIVDEEMVTSTVESVAEEKQAKPFLVPNGPAGIADPVTRRVQAALDYELTQGSMPA